MKNFQMFRYIKKFLPLIIAVCLIATFFIFYKPWRFSRSLSSVAVHKRKSLKGRSNAKRIARFIAFTRSYRALLLNERIFYRYTKGSQKCVGSRIRASDTNISLHLSA